MKKVFSYVANTLFCILGLGWDQIVQPIQMSHLKLKKDIQTLTVMLHSKLDSRLALCKLLKAKSELVSPQS